MAPRCERGLDQVLLSGYLDGELFQAEEQRVRVHLEDCAACQETLVSLAEMREAAMTTRFAPPADDQWRETPHGPTGRYMRGTGWVLLIVWAIGVAALAAYELMTGPEGLWVKLLVLEGGSGLGLLFLLGFSCLCWFGNIRVRWRLRTIGCLRIIGGRTLFLSRSLHLRSLCLPATGGQKEGKQK